MLRLVEHKSLLHPIEPVHELNVADDGGDELAVFANVTIWATRVAKAPAVKTTHLAITGAPGAVQPPLRRLTQRILTFLGS